MAQRHRIQRSLVVGLIAIVLVMSVHSEKPDTTRILIRHQQYRKLTQAADMIKMTWSPTLEKLAASIVEKCPTSVETVRSQLKSRNLGANLGTSSYPPPMQDGYPEDVQTTIIDQWGSERSFFYPDSGCASQPCNSWWQIVWSNASHVGCSLKVCGDKIIMVCIYNSRANNNTDAPFKVGKACSACPYGYTKCEDGICAPDQNAPTEAARPPDFLPAHGARSGAINENDKNIYGMNDNKEGDYTESPDSAIRMKVFLINVVCFFLLTLLF